MTQQFTFTHVSSPESEFVTGFHPEYGALVARNDSPKFAELVAELNDADHDPSYVAGLFEPAKEAEVKFNALSERIKVRNGRVYLDGDEVHNALTTQVARFIEEGVEDWKPLVAFFEKVQANPNDHSREQLFSWLDQYEFTITDEGDIFAYKGVIASEDERFLSLHSGQAIVNGEPVQGQVEQTIGDVVEMPRSEVAHDPTAACSTGLHVGSHSYASGYSRGAVLGVVVNPRDVVSVPTHDRQQKVRVCRYVVAEVTENSYESAVLTDDSEPVTMIDDATGEVVEAKGFLARLRARLGR